MRTLVTGSRGLLGSHILEKFCELGIDVIAPTRSELNLFDSQSTLRFMDKHAIEAVVHCAALVGGISENIKRPGDFILQNLLIDSSILSASLELRIPKLLYFGSSCMYPVDAKIPFQEDSILTGKPEVTNSTYALAKIAGTKSIEGIAEQYSLEWNTIVLSNIYGPRDNFAENGSHLLAAIIRKLYAGRKSGLKTAVIWGDGRVRREFTYVEDIAQFIADLWIDSRIIPRTMNLGVGLDYSVLEYYKVACSVLDYFPEFEFDLSKPIGIMNKLMDNSKAIKVGWCPTTTIELGLRKTIDWYSRHEL
jgi:nucleoside-diphosphate-sugar epimerase